MYVLFSNEISARLVLHVGWVDGVGSDTCMFYGCDVAIASSVLEHTIIHLLVAGMFMGYPVVQRSEALNK